MIALPITKGRRDRPKKMNTAPSSERTGHNPDL
jgi:hypothetical protein